MGVTEIKFGELHAFIVPKSSFSPKSHRHATRAASIIEREGEEREQEDRDDLQLQQLIVDDPMAFEQLAIQGIKDGRQTKRT